MAGALAAAGVIQQYAGIYRGWKPLPREKPQRIDREEPSLLEPLTPRLLDS